MNEDLDTVKGNPRPLYIFDSLKHFVFKGLGLKERCAKKSNLHCFSHNPDVVTLPRHVCVQYWCYEANVAA